MGKIDVSYSVHVFLKLLQVLPTTIFVAATAMIFAFIFSIFITAVRLKKIKVMNSVFGIYLSFFRSTPCMIHLFLIYYALPEFLKNFGIDLSSVSKISFAIFSLILFYSAYLTEQLRPAYLAVSKGQHDAAKSIGMTEWQRQTRIILPQVFPIAMPGLGNAWIELLKDTSVIFVIGVKDIMGKAKLLIANDYGVNKVNVYLMAGLIYWVMITGFGYLNKKIEQKRNKSKEVQGK